MPAMTARLPALAGPEKTRTRGGAREGFRRLRRWAHVMLRRPAARVWSRTDASSMSNSSPLEALMPLSGETRFSSGQLVSIVNTGTCGNLFYHPELTAMIQSLALCCPLASWQRCLVPPLNRACCSSDWQWRV